jgi:hypothetical protein
MEFVFWRTRECWPAIWVFQAFERDARTLYGPRYFAPAMPEIRLAKLRSGSVQILVLGSSRVTQFRAGMFAPMQKEFLNGGLMAGSTAELLSIVSLFTEDRVPAPKVIIVGLDPWWMKRGVTPPPARTLDDIRVSTTSAVAHLEAMRRYLKSPSVPRAIFHPSYMPTDAFYGAPAIGLGALLGNCYRADGSVQSCAHIADYLATGHYHDRETPPIIERIRTTSARFEKTAGLDWDQAEAIIAALRALQAKGIEVYAFLPPFSIECHRALQTAKDLSVWYAEYRTEFLHRVNSAGILCLDIPSPEVYGLSDDYMIDGFHPGDVFMTHVVEDLVRRAPAGSTLRLIELANLRALRQRPGIIPISLDPPPALAVRAASSP